MTGIEKRGHRQPMFFSQIKLLALPLLVLALVLVACDATPPTESSSASRPSKVAMVPIASPMRSASPAPSPAPVSPEFTGDPCAIVALEGATAIVDRIASDILRLQIRDTGGRIIGDSPAAVLSLQSNSISESVYHIAFYPLSPRELLAKFPEPPSMPTTGVLRLLSLNDLSVQERPLVLRCPEAVTTPFAGAEDVLTSPAVHAARLRQFISVLENAGADAPEKAGVVLDFMLLSAQDSRRLAKAQLQATFTDAVQFIETARRNVTPSGMLPGETFENFRAELEQHLSKLTK